MPQLGHSFASPLDRRWAVLPTARSARWTLPRRPRRTARAATAIYQPVTPGARLGWEAARLAAGLGGFRLLPSTRTPPIDFEHAVARHVPAGGSVAVSRSNHAGRWSALILDERGTCISLAKIATDDEGQKALTRESLAIQGMASKLPKPLSAAPVMASEDGMLLVRYVPWLPRWRAWMLPEPVAFALGRFYAHGSATHGDCTPSNLLATSAGWVLVDWEEATTDGPVFQDVCHYFVQSYALLRRPSARVLVDGFLHGRGPVGRAVSAYAKGADLPVSDAIPALRSYLRSSVTNLSTQGGPLQLDERRRLASSLRLLDSTDTF